MKTVEGHAGEMLTHWSSSRFLGLHISSVNNQTIDNLVAAMSSASASGFSLAKAFFDPSGLVNECASVSLQYMQFVTLAVQTTRHGDASQELEHTYLIIVLTLTVSTSYNFFNACLICLLFALTSTTKTSVLFSSIFFIALSVFNGCTMILCSSSLFSCGIDLRGYLGFRAKRRVLGWWKVVLRRILRTLVPLT